MNERSQSTAKSREAIEQGMREKRRKKCERREDVRTSTRILDVRDRESAAHAQRVKYKRVRVQGTGKSCSIHSFTLIVVVNFITT